MFVQLYTSRIILNQLGIDDYGIYTAVAGFIATFQFLITSTSTTILRFMSFSLGKNDIYGYNKYFTNSFFLLSCFSIFTLLFFEIFGLTFFNEVMVIPPDRRGIAMYVYQFSLLSFALSFFRVPYQSVIFSYEKMQVFAYFSIFDVVSKFLVAYSLSFFSYDSLLLYSFLYMIIDVVSTLLYRHFAIRIHKGLKISLNYDKQIIKDLVSFISWNYFGSVSGIIRGQGLNILINVFFGTAFNAARGIAYQIYNAINNFALNLMTAINPQIHKLYAEGDKSKWELLVCRGGKISFSLLAIIAYPIVMLMPEILDLWLGYDKYPQATVIFARLVLLNMLIECVSMPLQTLAQASGKVKVYQIIVGSMLILNLPSSFLAYKYFDAPAHTCFVIMIVINIIALILRLIILKKTTSFDVANFINTVLLKWIILLGLCTIGFIFCRFQSIEYTLISTGIITLIIIPIYTLGVVFNRNERKMAINFVVEKFRR